MTLRLAHVFEAAPGGWDAAHVGRGTTALLEGIRAILPTADALLDPRVADVELLGPDGFRSFVRASEARTFLGGGFNLYLRGLERDWPALPRLFTEIAADLGFGPTHVFVEAFIGKAGQVSTRHYDHDQNFQILLEGAKEWRLQPNLDIQNPLLPYHPGPGRAFREEAYAVSQATPAPRDDAWTRHSVTAGDVVFFPRGTWHEVTSLSDTFAVNIVLKGPTFAGALTSALEARLHRIPAFRAYLDGFAVGDATPPSRGAEFEALKTAAIAAIAEIRLEEAALSLYRGQRYAWIGGPDALDELELDDETGPPIRALAALRHPFTWEHALLVLQDLGAVGARNLVQDLVDYRLLKEIE